MPRENKYLAIDPDSLDAVGRASYVHCAETALDQVHFMRALVQGDVTDENHELALIEQKLQEIIQVA